MSCNGCKHVLNRMICLSLAVLVIMSTSVRNASASSRLPVKLSDNGENSNNTNEKDSVEEEIVESPPETKAVDFSVIIPEEEPYVDAEEEDASTKTQTKSTEKQGQAAAEDDEATNTPAESSPQEAEADEEETNAAEAESQNTAKKWSTFTTMFNGKNTGEGVIRGGAYYGDAEKLLSAMDRNPVYSEETYSISFRMMNGVRAVVGRDSVKIEYFSDIYARETDPQKQGLRVIDPSLGAPLLIVEGMPMINLEMLAGMLNLDGTWHDNVKVYHLKTEGFRTEQQIEMPYKIRIEKSKFRMYIYAVDDFGEYSILARECKVAVGRTSVLTPVGRHKITKKEEWHAFNNGWYAKYCSQYASGLYIHSELYRYKDLSKMSQNSYNQIGTKATSGCIRTYLEDAKWVYENCPIGTEIEIVN